MIKIVKTEEVKNVESEGQSCHYLYCPGSIDIVDAII